MLRLVALASAVTASLMAAPKVEAITPDQAREIAREAYIYGVPMVSMYGTMHAFSIDENSPEYKGPYNTVLNIARVFTPEDKAFVTPNSDTPYSFMGLDLRAEPVVVSVPEIEAERYFVFQLMDLYTFNFAYIGSRATGNAGGNFLIAGPGWEGETPAGIDKVLRAETEFVNVVGRTQLFDPDDLARVVEIQESYKVQLLSAFMGEAAPAAAPDPRWIAPLAPAHQQSSLEFFNVLAFALQFAPVHPSEVDLRDRFAEAGIVPGERIDFDAMDEPLRAAFAAGMEDGQAEIDARRAELGGQSDMLFGTREFLGNKYLARAVGTQVGIGANSREEALYPIYETDASGQPLDGAEGRYTLRFEPDSFPPVNAFWSLTMYDLPEQLLVANPIGRYLINSPMLPDLVLDPDGGLTILIQAEEPAYATNWLPAPAGPFMMAVRYYWPKPELLSGDWTSPAVQRVE
jgi:hypothetical protein